MKLHKIRKLYEQIYICNGCSVAPGCEIKPDKDIEWKKIAGLRDKIIYYYFGVNWDVLWDVIKRRTPTLKEQIKKILK